MQSQEVVISLKDDLLHGAAEIAEHIGESKRRVYYKLERGHIPAFKIGNGWHARKSALDRRYGGEI